MFTLNANLSNYVQMDTDLIKNQISMFLDTGSDLTLIKFKCVDPTRMDYSDRVFIHGITSGRLNSLGSIPVKFFIGHDTFSFKTQVMRDDFPLASDGILGRDFLQTFRVNVLYDTQTIYFENGVSLQIHHYDNCYFLESNIKPSRISRLIDIIGPKVPENFRERLLPLCEAYADIFKMEDEAVPANNFYKQKLILKDKEPVYVRQYKLPAQQKPEIEKQTLKLLHDGIIEPSTSNYNNPILLVQKKSDSQVKKWRLVVDFRKLNAKLVEDKFPIPRIDDIFDQLGNAYYFSVMDLASGFHQIELDEESRPYTAFSTPLGQFQFTRVPFGLNLAPNSFSRMMARAFLVIIPKRAFLYIDDVCAHGSSEEEHFENLQIIFEICRKGGLSLNPNKCQFFRDEVIYLGHKLTRNGIMPDPQKFAAIEKYPVPQNANETKRFVAFANYYRKFIKNFSTLTHCLNKLTKKNEIFVWTDECQAAFDTIRQKLMSPPVLIYPNFAKQFIVTTDASIVGCGAVLAQLNVINEERPICFASRNFTQGERNKPIIELELCALHWAIIYYKPYLHGTRFLVKTDHRPLVFLYNLKDPTSRLARIRLDLAEFNFDIVYIKGDSNIVADALSRISIESIRDDYMDKYEVLSSFAVYAITRSKTKELNTQLKTCEKPIKEPVCIITGDRKLLQTVELTLTFELINNLNLRIKIIDDMKKVIFESDEEMHAINERKRYRSDARHYKDSSKNENISNQSNNECHVNNKVRCTNGKKRMDPKPQTNLLTNKLTNQNPKEGQNKERKVYASGVHSHHSVSPRSFQIDSETLCGTIMKQMNEMKKVMTKINRERYRNDDENNKSDTQNVNMILLKISMKDKIFEQCSVTEFTKICNKLEHIRIYIMKNPITISDVLRQRNLISQYHNHELLGGHCGPARLYNKLRTYYYWPKMRKQVFEFTKSCTKCQMNKAHTRFRHDFEITDTPAKAFDLVEIDTVGPLPLSNGFKYILTIQCQLSKYVLAAPIVDKSAKTVARAIFEEMIFLHGFPRCILSDNGTEYKNEVLKEVNLICNVEHRFSTAYRPQTIGSLERNHRVLNDYLRSYMINDNWDSLVKYYVFAWNTTPNPHLSDYSPYFLVYGRNPNMPDFLATDQIAPVNDIDNYAQVLRYTLSTAQARVQMHLNKFKELQRETSMKHSRISDFKPGDIVKVTNEARRKFDSFFTGPYTVVGVQTKNYILSKTNDPKQYIVHRDRVHRYNDN